MQKLTDSGFVGDDGKPVQSYGDNFYKNSRGELVYKYSIIPDSGKRIINISNKKLEDISDNLSNDFI